MIALFVFVHCVVLRAFCALMNQRESHFFWSWWLSEAYISCLFQKTKNSKVEIQELCFRCGCKGGTSVSHRCHFDFTSIRFVAFDSKCCSVFSVLLSILLLRPRMVPGFSGSWWGHHSFQMTSSNGKIFVYSNLDGQGPASKSATHDLFPKQCLRLKDSYFFSIVLLHDSTIAGCQPTCLDLPRLSSAAKSLDSRIADCQPTCLDSRDIRDSRSARNGCHGA